MLSYCKNITFHIFICESMLQQSFFHLEKGWWFSSSIVLLFMKSATGHMNLNINTLQEYKNSRYTKASRGFYVPLSHLKRVNWLSCNVVGSFPLVQGMLFAVKTDKSITLLLHSERFGAIQKDTRDFLSYSLSSMIPISSRFWNKTTPNSVICNFRKILRKNTPQRSNVLKVSFSHWNEPLLVYITRGALLSSATSLQSKYYLSIKAPVCQWVCLFVYLFVCSLTPPQRRIPVTWHFVGWFPLGLGRF